MQLAFELDPVVVGRATKPLVRRGAVDITAKSILGKAVGRLDAYDLTLNPYRGCQFGCSYCYAAFFQPEPEKVEHWGEWVEVKSNALALLRADKRVAGAKMYVGSATDPYQPVELQTGLTRSLLGFMAQLPVQPRLVIQTRSPIVARDIDLLRQFKNLRVNMSITTDSEVVRRAFEPKTASIGRRIETVEKLVAAGIETGVCVSPMLPIHDPKMFAERLRATGASKFTTSAFHKGKNPYAAGTRRQAIKIAREMEWGGAEYVEAVIEMRAVLPELETKGEAFRPI